MTPKEKLYETLGELLYVVAKADGVIQEAEKEALEQLLTAHPWANEVMWSFNYEAAHKPDIADLYVKVISYCHRYGPAPEYDEFIDAMKTIAEAADGVVAEEHKVITSFSKDLIIRFRRDLELGLDASDV